MISQNREIEYLASLMAAHKALQATCHFFQYKEGTTEFPQPNGSGVLFEYNSNYYCLSNAHVITDFKLGKTFILLKDDMKMTLGGEYFFTKLPKTGRRDDTLDIAVVKLNSMSVIHLKERGKHFINIDQIKTAYDLNEKDVLLVAGFPGSKTKINTIKKRLITKPLIIRTVPFLKDLSKLNFPSTFHHVAKYPRNSLKNTITGEVTTAPKPHGISGSGLWILKGTSKNDYEPILIGILSEYLENRALLVSTKIDLFIDLIKQKYDPTIPNHGVQLDIFEE